MIGRRIVAIAAASMLVLGAGGPVSTRASTSPAFAGPANPGAPGDGQIHSTGRPRHVNVAKLPHVNRSRTSKAPPVLHADFGGKPAGGSASTNVPGPGAGAPAVASVATTLATLTATPSIVAGTRFAGIDDPTGCTGTPCLEPPDPWIAVGPLDIVQVTNAGIRITDRSGGNVTDVSQTDFFDDPDGLEYEGDARVVWDGLHERWLAVNAAGDCATGYLNLAVSDTDDPRGTWTIYYWWQDLVVFDFPGLGLSGDKVAFSANIFYSPDCSAYSYAGAWLAAVDSAALLTAPDPLPWKNLGVDPSLFTWRPSVSLSPGSDLPLVVEKENVGSTDIGFARVTGSIAAGTIAKTAVADLTTTAGLPAFVDPPRPSAFASASSEPVDGRPLDAIVQGSDLWFTSQTGCTPTGDDTERTCVRITSIHPTATPTKGQDFLVGKPTVDTFVGGIGLSIGGSLTAVWSEASSTSPAGISTWASYRLPSDPVNSLRAPVLVTSGTGTYAGERWGDYVGVAIDPVDPLAVWEADEVSTADGDWATEVVQLKQSERAGSTYTALTPARILDTRNGTGLTGALRSKVAKTFQVTGRGGVPANAVAVTGNLTVTGQTAAGYLYLGPVATNTPTSSTLNFPLADARANGVTVALGSGGTLGITYYAASSTATTQAIFDVTGYFVPDATGSTYIALSPARILDTRSNLGITGRLTSRVAQTFDVRGHGNVPDTAVAVTGNLTVTGQSAAGYLFLGPDPVNSPTSSTLNFPMGDARANGVTVKLGTTGTLGITYYAGSTTATTQAIFDVTGYFVPDGSGATYVALTPARILDTRIGIGLESRIANKVAESFPVIGRGFVPANALAVTGNLTVTGQTAAGYLYLGPAALNNPTSSTLNFPKGDNRANGVAVALSTPTDPPSAGWLGITYVSGTSGSTTHAIFDVTGCFIP